MFSLRPVFKASLALLIFLVSSTSVVVAQQQDVENATLATSNDDTTDLSLLMTNYNALREEGQGFYLAQASASFENPGVNISGHGGVGLHWMCDLEFSSNNATNSYGYVGRIVGYFLGATLEDAVANGAQNSSGEKNTHSVSAVMVPTLGIFDGQIHGTHDDYVFRYWDDGSSTLPLLGWEGDSPNADTGALSASGALTKITTEDAAKYLGMDVADMTPAACSMEYEAVWNATHVPDPIDTSAAIEHATKDIVMKLIITVPVIIGLVAN